MYQSNRRFKNLDIFRPGGRHYSDKLCSDRRYSDNPQSRRPSTSLAHLGICRNSRNWKTIGGVEVLHASKARHWLRHRGNLSPMHIGSGLPNFRTKILKCQTQYGAQIAPWLSGFGSASFQSVLPVDLFIWSQLPNVPTVDCRNSVCRNRVCGNSVVYPFQPSDAANKPPQCHWQVWWYGLHSHQNSSKR